MQIRQATIEDIPAIQRLYRELDRHHAALLPGVFRELDEDARPVSLIRDGILGAESVYLVADRDGHVAGFICIRKAAHPCYLMFKPHEFAMIEDAVVEQDRRGSGIGAMLFDAAIQWAKDHSLEYVQTTVWSANTSAREFYLRHGFKTLTEKLEMDLRDTNG